MYALLYFGCKGKGVAIFCALSAAQRKASNFEVPLIGFIEVKPALSQS